MHVLWKKQSVSFQNVSHGALSTFTSLFWAFCGFNTRNTFILNAEFQNDSAHQTPTYPIISFDHAPRLKMTLIISVFEEGESMTYYRFSYPLVLVWSNSVGVIQCSMHEVRSGASIEARRNKQVISKKYGGKHSEPLFIGELTITVTTSVYPGH